MWKKLLAWLESEHAYTGAKTADAVIAFMSEKGLNVEGEGGKAYTPTQIVEAYKKAVTVTIQDDATGEGMAVTGEPQPMGGEPEGAEMDDDTEEKMEDEEEKGDYRKSRRPTRGKNINQMLRAGHAPAFHDGNSEHARYDRRAKTMGVGANSGQTRFETATDAEIVGAQVRDAFCKMANIANPKAKSDNQILAKTGTTVEFGNAGALIAGVFDPSMIYIREKFGLFPRIIGTETMSEGTYTRPRSRNNLAAAYSAEAAAISPQNMKFDQVRLVADKLTILALFSNELLNDSAINIGDQFSTEVNQKFAYQTDDTIFNGDGTSAYGGFTGLAQALKNESATANPEDSPALKLVSGNDWSNITLDDYYDMRGLVGHFEGFDEKVQVCHKTFFEQVLVGLFDGHLGTSKADVAREALGRAQGTEYDFILDGVPGYFSQVMPSADANDSIPLIFGHPSIAATYGEVQGGLNVQTSTDYAFNQDALAMRATLRHAFNAHDIVDADGNVVLAGLITEDA